MNRKNAEHSVCGAGWNIVDYRLYMEDSLYLIPKWGEEQEIAKYRSLEAMGMGWLMTKRSKEERPEGVFVKEELLWKPHPDYLRASER